MSVSGLLDAWLTFDGLRLEEVDSAQPFIVEAPLTVEGGVAYGPVTLRPSASSVFPITKLRTEDQKAFAQWPADQGAPETVSPETESTSRAAPSSMDGCLSVRFAWPSPFDQLMPMISTPDDAHARALMCSIWERTQNDRDAARDEAVVAAGEWLSEWRTTVSRAWLQPIIATENEVGVITAIQSRFNVDFESLDEVYRDPRLRKQLLKPMKVRRAWGLPGLMWALLLDRLEAGQGQRACKRCGRLVQGRSHKRFCSKIDNKECYLARTRENRRRSRQSR
jgi:hypothetical protein